MAGFDKKRLRRELERDRRAKVRERLKELARLIREARKMRREAVQAVREECAAARKAASSSCALRAQREREIGAERIAARKLELEAERRDEKLLRAADRRGRPRVRATSSERRRESDDEVRANIPDGLVPVFDSVRRFIKGTPRKSRTEAFLEWTEENADEVYAIRNRQADREIAKLIAEQDRLERLNRRASLADVPF